MEGRKIIQWSLGGIAVALVVGYSVFSINDFVRGPRIIIESPLNGFSTTTPDIVVRGVAIRTNNVAINGAQTPVDLAGNFSNRLILAPGYNIIKITAKDNYERIVEKIIEINLLARTVATPLELTAQKSLLPTGQVATTTINNQF